MDEQSAQVFLRLVSTFRAPPESLDITEEEADRIIKDFRATAKRKIESGQVETVADLRCLSWETVDRVISEDSRQEMIDYIVRESYRVCLVEKPKKAKAKIEESREQI